MNYQKQCEDKMKQSINHYIENLATIRTGQANVKILDKIYVEYYGSPTPINQMASLQVVEGKQIVVKAYDRTVIKDIEKALSDQLDLPINNDGENIRITIPPLTEERRKEFVKVAYKFQEDAKVAIRNIRRDFNETIKKDKELSEDMQKSILDQIQKVTDKSIKEIEELTKEKEKSILKI